METKLFEHMVEEKFGGTVRDRAMVKLSGGEEVRPFLRVIGTEDTKVCFNFLIGLFSLSIHLRIICGGELDIVVEELCQFSGEGKCELWTSIRYQGVVKTKSFEHMVEDVTISFLSHVFFLISVV